jgi:hypothetical protein
MQLTKVRDLTLTGGIGAIAVAALALVAEALDLIPGRRSYPEQRRAEDERTGRATIPGEHGDLYHVHAASDGSERSTYVRPATEAEAEASELALDDFGAGSGVFAVAKDGEIIRATDERWAAALAEQPYGATGLTYYRVA